MLTSMLKILDLDSTRSLYTTSVLCTGYSYNPWYLVLVTFLKWLVDNDFRLRALAMFLVLLTVMIVLVKQVFDCSSQARVDMLTCACTLLDRE